MRTVNVEEVDRVSGGEGGLGTYLCGAVGGLVGGMFGAIGGPIGSALGAAYCSAFEPTPVQGQLSDLNAP